MRGILFFRIIVAVAVVAALGGVLVAVAGADDSGRLPDVTAPELLARMGEPSRAPAAVNGDVSWTNELFGALPFTPDHVAAPAASPLTASGSGRLWMQDGKVRFESQGQGGDQVVVADARAGTVWTYSFADDTARLYEWKGAELRAAGGDGEWPQAGASPSPPTPERVSRALQTAARFLSVEVSGQTVVAGRAAYVLTMRPAASDTALGRVEAAIDGQTYVPLRVDVLARGHEAPTLSFRFERVSFKPVDEAVFGFTPPAGATVERQTLGHGAQGYGTSEALGPDDTNGGAGAAGGRPEAEHDVAAEQAKRLARTALLTRAQAAGLVDFDLAWARASTRRAFRWAYVVADGVPLNALGSPVPVFEEAGPWPAGPGAAARTAGGHAGGTQPASGPAAVLLYGEGFGSVVLAQTKTATEVREQLRQLPEMVERVDLGGTEAQALVTPLGGVVVWERDGVTLLAAGMVPRDDLVGFARSVR